MRGIVRGAAYLPAFTDGRCRRSAFDEDEFTLAATALERAAPREGPDGRTQIVRAFGFAHPLEPSMVSAVLGSPVEVVPGGRADPPDIAGALAAACRGSGPEWVVAVVRHPEAAGMGPLAPPGEGSIALRVDDAPGSRPPGPILPAGSADRSVEEPFRSLFETVRADRGQGPWTGDWGADPRRGRTAPPSPGRRLDLPPFTVSEGAFVSGARYEKSRPSRWRFVGERCGACGARTFPSRGRCRGCGRTDSLAPDPLPLDGATVVAATWIGQGGQPTEFDAQVDATGPYGVVLAEVAAGVRATLAVSDATPDEVRVGSRVDTRLRRIYPIEGNWRYGRKAVPAPLGPRP